MGGLYAVSHAFYANITHNLDIVDGDTGAVAVYCNQVSKNVVAENLAVW